MLVPENRRRKTITQGGRGVRRDDGAHPAKERVARRREC